MNEPLSHDDLATYAHELRGALTVIAGYTELLRRRLPAAERESALDGIERAIMRADALCADALAGRSPASASQSFSPLSLSTLAEQVATDQRSATGRTITLTAERTAPVLGDATALARVLANVIDNAAKYSPSRAPIDLLVAEDTGATGSVVFIEVADRGPGISEEDLEKVVEPFVRLKRDAALPGTGLGMGIAHDVIAAHNGRISVLAREGGGTVVRLELPRA
jgi:two-component system sensor histidine kinase MprB